MCLERDGYTLVPRILDAKEVERLRDVVSGISDRHAVSRRGSAYGIRHLFDLSPDIRALASSVAVRALAEPVLGRGCFAVRATYFDKSPAANWALVWHQDRVIAVRERIDLAGWGPWANKGEVVQVQPPLRLLEGMLAVRVHLDDCGLENGPLRVLPGSHVHGRLDDRIDEWRARVKDVACTAAAGDALVMRPLILHTSSRAASPNRRRIIHVEYAAEDLPGGLQWRHRI